MKIRFIFPKWQKLLDANPDLENILPGYYFGDFNMPGLAIESVAALTPDDIDISLTDDHLENINFDEQVDLVAITAFTPQATRGYKIAERFRQKGVPVVMGGIHPSLMPEEAASHADYVIIGHADGPWQRFLEDFRQNKTNKFYQRNNDDPFQFPYPKRDLFKRKGYVLNSIVILSRGCQYNCPACVIPLVDGRNIHLRPVNEVVRDITSTKVENIFLADESLFLMGDKFRNYAYELFSALSPLKKNLFVTVVGLTTLKDKELKSAREAGVKEIYCVFAYPPVSLSVMTKSIEEKIISTLKRIHDNGIEIFASFGLGFDYDGKGVFERSINFAHKTECDLAEFFIATPFPRTPFFNKLREEGRLLHQDWSLYNAANVVFKPKNMEIDELHKGYIQCWKEFYQKYSFDNFGNRFFRYWGMNKEAIKELYDKKRAVKQEDAIGF